MANKYSKTSRTSFKEWYNTAIFNPRCKMPLEAYKEGLRRFFTNNEYLCHLRGMSEHAYLNYVYKETGFRVSYSFFHNLKSGKRVSCSPHVLMTMAACHDMYWLDMLMKDYTKPVTGSQVA